MEASDRALQIAVKGKRHPETGSVYLDFSGFEVYCLNVAGPRCHLETQKGQGFGPSPFALSLLILDQESREPPNVSTEQVTYKSR